MTRVLLLTGDPIGGRMAGPAIRAWNMALELQRAGHDARIVTTAGVSEDADPTVDVVPIRIGDERALADHESWAEIVVVQGYGLGQFPRLAATTRMLVADLYAPFHLELREQGSGESEATLAIRVDIAHRAILDQLGRADLLLCANERQRQLYLRELDAIGRSGGDDLLQIVPFGLPAEQPEPSASPVLRGVLDGIDAESKLLIWGGGVYDWFDPLTLIRAVALLRERLPEVRLLFLGTRNPRVGSPGMVGRAVALAEELGVAGREVLFNDDWVPYEERGAYLLEADAGVSTHPLHEETTYAFRTRILDYLWAGLPMVVTEGDGFADLVAEETLGLVVPEADPDALAAALETVLTDEAAAARYRANIPAVAARFTWPRALEPLLAAAAAPRHAADYRPGREGMSTLGRVQRTAGIRHDMRMGWHHLRSSGLGGVAERIRIRRGAGA